MIKSIEYMILYQYFHNIFSSISIIYIIGDIVFWNCRCFNISKEKVQSYIRFISKEILDNITNIFLKQNGINSYGIKLEERLKMCRSYETYSYISEEKDGVLYHNGDRIDLNEFLNGNIVRIEKNESDFFDLIEFDNSI